MRNARLLFALLIIFCCTAQLHAQAPNYSGTWILNNAKSKIESRPEGMTSSIFIIMQKGEDFNLTIHHVFGKAQDTIVIAMPIDGKTRRILSVLNGKLEQQKDGLHITLWKDDFLDKVIYKFGTNNNEFIADETLKSSSDNHHNIWVFNRSGSK